MDPEQTEIARHYERVERSGLRWRRIRNGAGIFAAAYVVYLWGMYAGEDFITRCVRSHDVDTGPDSTTTVCDFRVLNGHHIRFSSPIAQTGIPHVPGSWWSEAVGLIILLVAAGFVLYWSYLIAWGIRNDWRKRRAK